MSALVAITGGTGFLGRHLVSAFHQQGWRVRILARRDPTRTEWRGIPLEVVPGGLEDEAAMDSLCRGAVAVVHAAGLVKARSYAGFAAVNEAGARRTAHAAKRAGTPNFLLISSLAAREPGLSAYAASKRAGEQAVLEVLGDGATIVRPPAIYGPGDLQTFRLFKTAAQSPVLPVFAPHARIAMIHVADAAAQIVALAARPPGGIIALSDGKAAGYSWRELAETAAQAVGTRPKIVQLPGFALTAAGFLGALARLAGATPMLTPGKARELRHPDWSLKPSETAFDLPKPYFALQQGFADTVNWCRKAGWLAK